MAGIINGSIAVVSGREIRCDDCEGSRCIDNDDGRSGNPEATECPLLDPAEGAPDNRVNFSLILKCARTKVENERAARCNPFGNATNCRHCGIEIEKGVADDRPCERDINWTIGLVVLDLHDVDFSVGMIGSNVINHILSWLHGDVSIGAEELAIDQPAGPYVEPDISAFGGHVTAHPDVHEFGMY